MLSDFAKLLPFQISLSFLRKQESGYPEHKTLPDSRFRGNDIFILLFRRISIIVFIICLCFINSAGDAETKNNKNIAEHTQAIASQLSCVVCSGQSVASSNAALAQDMRAFIATKLRAGQSRSEIKTFLRKRYGDKILMRPPVKPATYILWAAPLLALLAGTGIIYGFCHKGRQA